MRTLALALLLVALPGVAAAEEGVEEIRLVVGDEAPITGFRPVCDDPSIVAIRAEGKGTVRALKAGTTLCSLSAGSPLGVRTVLRIVVVAPDGSKDGAGKGGGEGGGAGSEG